MPEKIFSTIYGDKVKLEGAGESMFKLLKKTVETEKNPYQVDDIVWVETTKPFKGAFFYSDKLHKGKDVENFL